MRIINRPKGSGKTYELVKMMMMEPGNEDIVYVAPTYVQAERIAKRLAIQEFGAKPSPELSMRFTNAGAVNQPGRHYPPDQRFVIDELDGVIGGIIGGNVVAVAGTDEKHKEIWRTDKSKHFKRQALKEMVSEAVKGRDEALQSGGNPFLGDFRDEPGVAKLVKALNCSDALDELNEVLQEVL